MHGDYFLDPTHENKTYDAPIQEDLSCPETR
jgi:hypothetical protein